MKATLTFNLPEESREHHAALEGLSLAVAVAEFDDRLRNMVKYEDKDTIEIDAVRDLLRECLAEYSVTGVWE